jgi:hypothetical protein
MRSINLTRLTIGSLVILGLVFWLPVAYFAGAMMVFAGVTNVCLLERLFARLPGSSTSCSLARSQNPGPSDRERSKAVKLGLVLSSSTVRDVHNLL